MATRLIDVLTDNEKVLDRRVAAAKELLASVNQRVADARREHENICKNLTNDKKACETLKAELRALGEIKTARETRMDPAKAKEEYKALKPDRYDVSIMQVYHHGHSRNIFYVKMYWGNVCRMLYEGPDLDLATTFAENIATLTGQDRVRTYKVASKKDLWST